MRACGLSYLRDLLRLALALRYMRSVSAWPLLASKNFVKPAAQPAITYPAHDDHPTKGGHGRRSLRTPEKAKIFTVNFAAQGFLPVFFVVTNDGEQPISLANMKSR